MVAKKGPLQRQSLVSTTRPAPVLLFPLHFSSSASSPRSSPRIASECAASGPPRPYHWASANLVWRNRRAWANATPLWSRLPAPVCRNGCGWHGPGSVGSVWSVGRWGWTGRAGAPRDVMWARGRGGCDVCGRVWVSPLWAARGAPAMVFWAVRWGQNWFASTFSTPPTIQAKYHSIIEWILLEIVHLTTGHGVWWSCSVATPPKWKTWSNCLINQSINRTEQHVIN